MEKKRASRKKATAAKATTRTQRKTPNSPAGMRQKKQAGSGAGPITFQEEPHTDKETLAQLHPIIRDWWTKRYKEFSPPQRYAILNIHRGENTLISSPTGSGKTLSAFLAILNNLAEKAAKGELEERVYCVYLSPLKALANDITKNLKGPLKEIEALAKQERGKRFGIRVGTRTGDTTPSQRATMLKRPPHILVTTPESLAISLTTTKFREMLRTTEFLIIDEIHALAENKRGVHMSLSVERLEALVTEQRERSLTRIGLSATVHPLESVAQFLVGLSDPAQGTYRPCRIVDVQALKQHDLKVLCPVPDIMRTTHAKQQAAMYELLHELIQKHKTTLIFTNTRSATERVVHQLKERYPRDYASLLDADHARDDLEGEEALEAGKDPLASDEGDDTKDTEAAEGAEAPARAEPHKGYIGAHHGSLSKAHRFSIENRLKNGELKAVVCSTSLELGIDIGSIDLVVLLGSPKSVARALQRIGRAGHQLHETAKGRIIVLDRDDMVECSILLKAAIERKIDRLHIPLNALDVLAQQVFGLAIEARRQLSEVKRIVKSSHCYATLSDEEFQSVIDYLAGEYASLEQRNVYAKIWHDKETGEIGRRGKLARLLYLTNVGTIPDETSVKVKLGEEIIGTIDEGFLERLKPGDVFVLGGEAYEFRFSRGLTAQVKVSTGRPPTVPNWVSEMLPLSFDLAGEILRFRRHLNEIFSQGRSKEDIMEYTRGYLYADERTVHSVYQYFREQHRYALVPHERRLLIEHFREGSKRYVIVHSLYGRRVNDVLSRALAYALGKIHGRDVEVTISDNGFSLRSTTILNIRKAFSLLKAEELGLVMKQALEKSEVLRRRFRHCAARALMILRSYKGASKSVGKQQMSSRLLMSAVKRISDDFPILKEARREVLEDLMDLPSAREVVEGIERGTVQLDEISTDLPSPFAFSIVLWGYVDILKMEEKKEFLKRMHEEILRRIDGKRGASSDEDGQEEEAAGGQQRISFSYDRLWREHEERRLAERDDEQERLKRLAWNLHALPVYVKEELVKLVEGADRIRPDVEAAIGEHRDDILRTWPRELRTFVFDRLGIPYDKRLDEEEERRVLLRDQLRRAARRTGVEPEIVAEAERLIDGEEPDGKLWGFVDTLLAKAVPKAWKDEIVKFLSEERAARAS